MKLLWASLALLIAAGCQQQTTPPVKVETDTSPRERVDFVVGQQRNFTLSFLDKRSVVNTGELPMPKGFGGPDKPIVFYPALTKQRLADFSPRVGSFLDSTDFKRMSIIILVKDARQVLKGSLLSKQQEAKVELEVHMRNGQHASQAQGLCEKSRSSIDASLAAINALYNETFGCAVDHALQRLAKSLN